MLTEKIKELEKLIGKTGLPIAEYSVVFEKDIRNLPDPLRAINNLLRYLETGFASLHLTDFINQPKIREVALRIFSQSQYLADILVRHTELLGWLTMGGGLEIEKSPKDVLNEASQTVEGFERVDKKLDALKRFQRREILLIGAKEILGKSSIVQSTYELSILADSIVHTTIKIGIEEFQKRYGFEIQNTLACIGLGKLGGNELNFSSDIDLIFVYNTDGDLPKSKDRISTYHEYYSRLTSWIVQRLTEKTNEGHFYRVDLRLRPEGESGAVVLSRGSYYQYYETRGELWERQMLQKGRFVAGDQETGRKFLSDLRPFIYPKTHLSDPIQEIHCIKRKIESHIDDTSNVKLGSGGIRDIEFVVQALQILNVATNEEITSPNTLEGISKLHDSLFLEDQDAKSLREAYIFLRKVEHRLQLLYGFQTHSLPESEEEYANLAYRLGYDSPASLERDLEAHRKSVRRIFESMFMSVTDENVRFPVEGKRSAQKVLYKDRQKDQGTINGGSVLEIGKRLIGSLAPKRSSELVIRNFEYLLHTPELKRGIEQAAKNEKLLEIILLICARSDLMVKILAREPLLFESMIGMPEVIFDGKESWVYMLESDPFRFKLYNEFKFSLSFLRKEIDIVEFTHRISSLAERIIKRNIEKIISEEEYETHPFCFIGLGKFGGSEMTLLSDIDGFVVARSENIPVVEKIIKSLLSHIEQERTYEFDFRLRPEGSSSPLITAEDYIENYFVQRGSIWECLALSKSRFISGDIGLWEKIYPAIDRFVFGGKFQHDWIDQLQITKEKIERHRGMDSSGREDLKTCAGGVMDLEFLIQAVLIRRGLRSGQHFETNSFRILETLLSEEHAYRVDWQTVKKNLRFLRELETFVRLNSDVRNFVLPSSEDVQDLISNALGEESSRALVGKIHKIKRENRGLLLQTLDQLKKYDS